MGLGQQSLNQLVDVVVGLLEWVSLVDPIEDDVTRALMPQLQRHFILICGFVLLCSGSSKEEQSLVALSDEAVILTCDGWGCISRVILFHI